VGRLPPDQRPQPVGGALRATRLRFAGERRARRRMIILVCSAVNGTRELTICCSLSAFAVCAPCLIALDISASRAVMIEGILIFQECTILFFKLARKPCSLGRCRCDPATRLWGLAPQFAFV
jgi:hypothetical protein